MVDDEFPDEALLVIPDRSLALKGWKQIRITRGIERLPSDFSISMTERFIDGDVVAVNPQDPFQLMLGGQVVMTGYVDTVTAQLDAQSHTVAVAGRSKCSDLVDCSAEWPGMQIVNSNIQRIAEQLAVPYKGLSVVCDATDLPIVAQLNILFGETPFSILERVSRYSAVLVYDNPEGNLVITRGSDRVAAGGFEEGVNVETVKSSFSALDRFSEYLAVQQSLDTFGDMSGGSLNTIIRIGDAHVRRRRQRAIVAENVSSVGIDVTFRRTIWEMNRRSARSAVIHITTDSWRDSAGDLWEPNTLVQVKLPTVKMEDATLMIGEVTYRLDESGTHADLVLMAPDAFQPEPFVLQLPNADVTTTDVSGVK